MESERWTIQTFGECAELIREGIDPQSAAGKPYVALEHIRENGLYLDGYGKAEDAISTKSRFREGDILFGKLRPYFRKVIIAPFDGVCSTDIWVVRAKHNVDQRFLFYWMASPEFVDIATRGSEGTKMPRAKWDFVSLIERPLPPLPEQRAIAAILGALDDKIELNRQMNATLEAIARALFKSWFVDFDPVRAKAEGRRMKAEIAALFPDELVDSELGEIPKGWRVGTVGEDFNITMGQSPPGETYNENGDGLPFYQGRRDFGFRYPSIRVYCNAPTRFAAAGDTLVSVRAPVGDLNIATQDCCIGRGIAAVRHKTGSRSYTYYAMQSSKYLFDRFEAEGTVFGSLNKQDFHRLSFLIPPSPIVNLYESEVFPIDQKIEINEQQSIILAALRDTLLPKLISGELRVSGEFTQDLQDLQDLQNKKSCQS